MQSKYLKTSQEFYDELFSDIKANDSHRVLSTLLRMGFAQINIAEIVSGDNRGAPLYLLAVGKDITILQHLKEFGALIPNEIQIPEPASPRPKGLAHNTLFAQHFVIRRTKVGKEIFNYQAACTGFCYEYARFCLSPHKKRTNEDFLDKLLRKIYERSDNFYNRIYSYQKFAEHRINKQCANLDLLQKEGILGVYSEELKNAELVQVSVGFEQLSHQLVIRKINTTDGIRYQLFDPSGYDSALLKEDELNKRFKDHIKNYTENWLWGKLVDCTVADLGKQLRLMGHLQQHENKFPFKNLHLLRSAFAAKDINTINFFVTNFQITADNIDIKYSIGDIIDKYLWNVNNDAAFKQQFLTNLPVKTLVLLADKIFTKNDFCVPQHLFDLFMVDDVACRLPKDLANSICKANLSRLSPG